MQKFAAESSRAKEEEFMDANSPLQLGVEIVDPTPAEPTPIATDEVPEETEQSSVPSEDHEMKDLRHQETAMKEIQR